MFKFRKNKNEEPSPDKPKAELFCANCGHGLEAKTEFCPECGHKVERINIEKPKQKYHLLKATLVVLLAFFAIGIIGQGANENQAKKIAELEQQQIADEQRKQQEEQERQAQAQAQESTPRPTPKPAPTPTPAPPPPPAQSPAAGNWSGSWLITSQACNGFGGNWTATVEENGDVSGSYADTNAYGYISGGFSGTVQGTSWNVSGSGGDVSFIGTLNGSSVSGNFDGPYCTGNGDTSGTFSGLRS